MSPPPHECAEDRYGAVALPQPKLRAIPTTARLLASLPRFYLPLGDHDLVRLVFMCGMTRCAYHTLTAILVLWHCLPAAHRGLNSETSWREWGREGEW